MLKSIEDKIKIFLKYIDDERKAWKIVKGWLNAGKGYVSFPQPPQGGKLSIGEENEIPN